MNFATLTDISKSYGTRLLFSEVNFVINQGESIALVAKNGSGKSTLLKIIQGIETPDTGKVELLKDVQVFSFEQSDAFKDEQMVEEILFSHSHPILELISEYKKLVDAEISDERFMNIISKIDEQNAWNVESMFSEIFTNLKIDFLQSKVKNLSGGQRKRISLAKFLIDVSLHEGHQLLILDEPTNHLDIEMVEWLEYFLNKENRTILLVTHDRYFLDAICTQILELEDKQIYIHRGSYQTYVSNKALRIENQQATIDKANNLYKRELEWMRRQPKARTTKSKSRQQAFYETEKVAKKKIINSSILLEIQMSRLGKKIIECKNVSFQHNEDKIILDNFSHVFAKGQKLGIIGKNGVGKTTFLNILEGKITNFQGEVEKGETLVFGHFSQSGIIFKEEQRVIDYVTEIAEFFPLSNERILSASQFLQLFLFDAHQQYTQISKLSGGEKKRLQLLSVLYKNPNFLILDEPTNDLDLPTLTILENFLKEFQGCVLIVSHDRYFMDKVVDELLIFEGNGKIKLFYGSYTEYFIEQEQLKNQKSKEEKSQIQQQHKVLNKLTFNEKKILEKLNIEIPELEYKKEIIEKEMNLISDSDLIIEKSNEYQQLIKILEKKEMLWLELSEKES